jgi:hypothetical protein
MRYFKSLLMILILASLVNWAQAEWDVQTKEPGYYFLPGESFTVEIQLTNTGNTIDALGFDFTFPADLLDYTSHSFTGTLLESWMFKDVLSPQAGTIRIAGFTLAGAIVPPDSGSLVRLNFTVKTDVSGNGQFCFASFTDDLVQVTTRCSAFSTTLPGQTRIGPAEPLYEFSAGQSFTVAVRVTETQADLDALGFDFNFPDALLQYDGFNFTGAFLENWQFKEVRLNAPGSLRIAGFSTTPIPAGTEGDLVQLLFTVKSGAQGQDWFWINGLTDDLSAAKADSALFQVSSVSAWQVPIKIILNDTTIFTFGGHPNASDAFDPAWDKPTAPPGFGFYACFSLPVFPGYLSTDIRRWVTPFDTPLEWQLKILNVANQTVTIAWDPDQLPVQDTFTLEGRDMRTCTSVQVNRDTTLHIKYSTGITTRFDFPQPGWYLISIPVQPDDNHLSALFPGITHAFAFDSGTQSYVTVTQFEVGIGYWLLVPSAMNVTVTGVPVTHFREGYDLGWHCIGTVIDPVDFAAPADDPDGAVLAAFSWNPETRRYETVFPAGSGQLQPNQGYWLAVAQRCTLTVGQTPAPSARIFSAENSGSPSAPVPPPPPFVAQVPVVNQPIISNALVGNYPNPFNPETTIQFSLREPVVAQLQIYNAIGQKIRVLADQNFPAGSHRLAWDGKNDQGNLVPSGIYLLVISTPSWQEGRKMMLLK